MRFGLPISIVLHASILFWALFSVSARVELKPVQEIPIAVELLSISDKTDLRAGDRKAKTEAKAAVKKEEPKPEAKEEKKKERVAVLPPKAEEPKKETNVEDPIADVLKKTEEKPPEPKKEEPKKEAKKEPPKKAEPKKLEKKKEKKKKTDESFDDTVAALLNKVPNPSSASSSNAEADPQQTKPVKSIGGESTTGSGLSVAERDMIGAIIRGKIRDERCWNPPTGAAGADQIAVRLKFKLRRDGSVDGVPSVLNNSGAANFMQAAEAAVRAVLDCSPYEPLATQLGDLYDTGWNSVTVNFRPDQMFGG